MEQKVNSEHIYFSPPFVGELEEKALIKVIRSGWVAPAGPDLRLFESALCSRFKFPNVLALNSGTAALHLALILAGVKAKDVVLVGTFTFIAAANAVKYVGATPIFIDSEEHTWNLDPALLIEYLEAQQNSDRMPKAVIVTHIFGRAAQISAIAEICTRFGVKLIEDAAEALGTEHEGKNMGGFGDFGVLSFNGNKIITTGGGGALICQKAEDHVKALLLATQFKSKADHYLHHELGFNYRMSNVLAALGLAQLAHFNEIIKRKQQIHAFYESALAQTNSLEISKCIATNHWVFPILIKSDAVTKKINPSIINTFFEQRNIEVRRFWRPMHLQPLYAQNEFVGSYISKRLFDQGICLPSGAGLDLNQLQRVVDTLIEFLQQSEK